MQSLATSRAKQQVCVVDKGIGTGRPGGSDRHHHRGRIDLVSGRGRSPGHVATQRPGVRRRERERDPGRACARRGGEVRVVPSGCRRRRRSPGLDGGERLMPKRTNPKRTYPRMVRVNELLREVVAEADGIIRIQAELAMMMIPPPLPS